MGSPSTLGTRDILTKLLTPADVRNAIDTSCVTLARTIQIRLDELLEQDYYKIIIQNGKIEITISRDDTEKLPEVILDRLNEIFQGLDSEWRVKEDPSSDECIILYQVEREKKDEK